MWSLKYTNEETPTDFEEKLDGIPSFFFSYGDKNSKY